MVEFSSQNKPFTIRLVFEGQCIPLRLSESAEESKEIASPNKFKSFDIFETFENVDIDKMTCEDIVEELKLRRDFSEIGV